MTLAELIAQFRTDADDLKAPYLSLDEDVTLWLNEAEEEAAIRARLIHEADDPAVCEIAVVAGVNKYPVHPAALDITLATFTPTGCTKFIPVGISDRLEQDRVHPGWRRRSEEPRILIQNDTTVQLACLPTTAGLLAIECYRLPLEKMAQDGDEPEIGAVHHRHLVHWALHRCYSRPDAEVHDPGRAEKAEAAFTTYFGIRPDAEMRRNQQANRPQFNKAVW